MIECVTEDKENGIILHLSGSLVIEHAVEVSSLFVDAVTANDCVEIDVSSAAEVDVSILQLLCAAHKMAIGLNKTVRFTGSWSDAFIRTAQEACFLRDCGCTLDSSMNCLWIRE